MGPQLFLFTLVYMCTVIVFSMTLTSKMRKDTQKGREVLEKNAILLTVCIFTPIINTLWCTMYMIAVTVDFLKKKLLGCNFSPSAIETGYRKWFAKIFI